MVPLLSYATRQYKRDLPAQSFIGTFLVDSHHIHKLQTSSLQRVFKRIRVMRSCLQMKQKDLEDLSPRKGKYSKGAWQQVIEKNKVIMHLLVSRSNKS